MGMGPDEITKIARQINWKRIFTPIPPYDTLNFRRKEDRREYSFYFGASVVEKDNRWFFMGLGKIF